VVLTACGATGSIADSEPHLGIVVVTLRAANGSTWGGCGKRCM